jgi:hypothetical protein
MKLEEEEEEEEEEEGAEEEEEEEQRFARTKKEMLFRSALILEQTNLNF